MLKRRLLILVFVLLMLMGIVCAAKNEAPYAIKVNCATNTVTIYEKMKTELIPFLSRP